MLLLNRRTIFLLGVVLAAAGCGSNSGTGPASAPSCDRPDESTPLSFARVSQLVQSCRLSSVDEVLPLLPQEYRDRYTLVYDSRSLQFASPEHPRVISFGKDAHFVMGFSGDSSQFGFDKLETVEFQQPTKSFVYRELVFSNGQAHDSGPNPAQCLHCHRQDPRPNWDGYFLWPGVFGAEDQGMFGKTGEGKPASFPVEKALYARYLPNRHQGRYQYLSDFKGFKESGSNPEPLFPNGRIDYFSRCDHNLGLTQMLGGFNAQRITDRITSNPLTRPYRYAILAALSCSRSDFPADEQDIESYLTPEAKLSHPRRLADIRKEVLTLSRNSFMERLNRHFAITGLTQPEDSRVLATWKASPDSEYGNSFESRNPPAASMLYVLQGTDVDMQDWSMEFEPDGSTHYSFHVARGQLGATEEFYWQNVLDPLADADLLSMYRPAIQNGWAGFFLDWEGNERSVCDLLRRKSLAALSDARTGAQTEAR